MFSLTSHYYGIERLTTQASDGRTVTYVRRRFVPSPDRFELVQEHVVTEGERYDTVAALTLGDPEQFWRLCDANGVLDPKEIEEVGRRVRVTLPEGIPGARRA